jgi:hypothetical protein
VELRKVEITQKKRWRESFKIFWPASFKTNIFEKVNLKRRTDPVPTAQ